VRVLEAQQGGDRPGEFQAIPKLFLMTRMTEFQTFQIVFSRATEGPREEHGIRQSRAPSWETRAPQREDDTQHWSRGDLVKVHSKTADDWHDAYVLIQRGRNLLLVIPEGMIHPCETRQTRLSLIAEEESGAYCRSLERTDY
jgi:hypothetical protein